MSFKKELSQYSDAIILAGAKEGLKEILDKLSVVIEALDYMEARGTIEEATKCKTN